MSTPTHCTFRTTRRRVPPAYRSGDGSSTSRGLSASRRSRGSSGRLSTKLTEATSPPARGSINSRLCRTRLESTRYLPAFLYFFSKSAKMHGRLMTWITSSSLVPKISPRVERLRRHSVPALPVRLQERGPRCSGCGYVGVQTARG